MAGLEQGSGGDFAVAVADDSGDSATTAVVVLQGDLDMASVDELERALTEVLARPECSEVVFDLSELQFIDSSGLAVLLKVAGSGRRILLRHPSSIVRELVAITGLADVLAVEPVEPVEPNEPNEPNEPAP